MGVDEAIPRTHARVSRSRLRQPLGDDYQPPQGDDEPPMDPTGADRFRCHVVLSELMSPGRNGNGDGGNGQDDQ